MELKGEAGLVRVYDSYAHHPAEIAGDLEAARTLARTGRVLVVFQPHLVSRTRRLGAEMGQALGAADEVVVLDVYVAREDPDPDVTGALVADAVPLPEGAVAFVPSADDALEDVLRRARPGDLVLTLGAGSVTDLAPRILRRLSGGAA
jgi:UDP-N-acetylmuramate--alanine ligase